jgi:uncharacterized protein YeaO (DUF488 family)
VYDKFQKSDGMRILVDRLWPRGVSKRAAHLDEWLREVGPSNELRKWFGHKAERWKAFEARYRHELHSPERQEALMELKRLASKRTVTLLFGARDMEHNNAVVIGRLLGKTAPHGESIRETSTRQRR